MRTLNGATLVTYLVHAVPLNFNKQYKAVLIQCGDSLMTFLWLETEKNEVVRDPDNLAPRESVYRYFT